LRLFSTHFDSPIWQNCWENRLADAAVESRVIELKIYLGITCVTTTFPLPNERAVTPTADIPRLAVDSAPRNLFPMHRLPNKYSVTRFRFAALLLLGKWGLLAVSAAMLVVAVCISSRDLVHLAIGLMALALPVTVAQWLLASRARCPLCIGHPPAPMHERIVLGLAWVGGVWRW